MANATRTLSENEMDEMFFEGVENPYQLYIANSKMPEAGFGLFAREKIPAGMEVLRTMPAVSAVMANDTACDTCFNWVDSIDPFKPPVELLVCASCKRVRYCSKRCQRAAWKRYHKQECTIYREIDAQVLKSKQDSLAIQKQWKTILALESHKDMMKQSKDLDVLGINADIRYLEGVIKSDMSESDLQDLYWRINANQHSVDSPLRPPLGSCLVPCAAVINHSCSSNAHQFYEEPDLTIRSIREIAKDEEITISYIDSTQSFEERQEALSGKYGFGCQCCKCLNGLHEEGEILTGEFISDESVRNAKSKLHALLDALADRTQGPTGAETLMREICNGSSPGKPWPITAFPLPNLYIVLAQRLEEEQRWEKALQVWLKIVYIIDPLRYPERLNPHRVEDLMALCQLEGRISQISEANAGVRASFRAIESAISTVLFQQNIQLKEDAAASLGTHHTIYKVAASYVEKTDRQMMMGLGVSATVWQSEAFKDMKKEMHEERKRELFKWAGIDLNTKTM